MSPGASGEVGRESEGPVSAPDIGILASVVYLDLVAYSKLRADQQSTLLKQMQEVIRATFSCQYAPAERLVLQIGDGVAIILPGDVPHVPVTLAIRLAKGFREHGIEVRIGVHAGSVIRIKDFNDLDNVAGPGINIAQRVMAFGDAGHIMVSEHVVGRLREISHDWDDYFHDLGEQVVKHGDRVHLFSLWKGDVGNSNHPSRLPRSAESRDASSFWRRWRLAVLVLAFGAIGSSAYLWSRFVRRPPEFTNFTKLTDGLGQEVYPSVIDTPEERLLIYASKVTGYWKIHSQKFRSDGMLDPEVVPLNDGEWDDTQPAVSPTGSHIAFRSEQDGGGIYVMNSTGGVPHRLTWNGVGYNPCWSRDGLQIVFASESILRPEDRVMPTSKLWTIRKRQGGNGWDNNEKLLYKGDAVQPAWSPHGHRIAFWRSKGGQRDIVTIRADGQDPVEVTSDEHIDWNPVWSDDGSYLYFSSDRSGHMNLWRIPIDELSGKTKGNAEAVSRSPTDLSHISFSGRDQMLFVQRDLRVNLHRKEFNEALEPVDAAPAVEVTTGTKQAARVDVSPDGEWLSFTYARGKHEEIFVVDKDGGKLRQVTEKGWMDRGPRWSPDGRLIAFFSKRPTDRERETKTPSKWAIWIANRDGTGRPKQITEFEKGVIYPIWSPIDARMAYTVAAEPPTVEIAHLGNASLSGPQALPPLPNEGEVFLCWSWSPNGAYLAGFRQRKDNGAFSGITIYSFSDGQYRDVTNIGSDPVWLNDSKRILFHHNGAIHLVSIDRPHEPRQILLLTNDIARRGFGLTRDNRLIFFSVEQAESDVWMATPSNARPKPEAAALTAQ